MNKRSVRYFPKVGRIQTKAINLAQDTEAGPVMGVMVQPGHSDVSAHTDWNGPERVRHFVRFVRTVSELGPLSPECLLLIAIWRRLMDIEQRHRMPS